MSSRFTSYCSLLFGFLFVVLACGAFVREAQASHYRFMADDASFNPSGAWSYAVSGWARSMWTDARVNRDNPECEVSRNGPFGEITMRSRFIPAFTPLGRERATLGWDTCYSDWRGGYPSYWFEMWTPWSYDYSTVTAMNSTYHDHAVPLFVWSDQDAYNDW